MTIPDNLPFEPRSANDDLAMEIARAFSDTVRLSLYREACSAYGHTIVYRAFREAMAVPIERVRSSRRAIFFFILKSYDRKN